jgi:hypothetical protein
MKSESHLQIIVHAKTIQTRYCCEFIKRNTNIGRIYVGQYEK